MIETLRKALDKEHQQGKAIRAIAAEIGSISQPALRNFHRGGGCRASLMETLAARYGYRLTKGKP